MYSGTKHTNNHTQHASVVPVFELNSKYYPSMPSIPQVVSPPSNRTHTKTDTHTEEPSPLSTLRRSWLGRNNIAVQLQYSSPIPPIATRLVAWPSKHNLTQNHAVMTLSRIAQNSSSEVRQLHRPYVIVCHRSLERFRAGAKTISILIVIPIIINEAREPGGFHCPVVPVVVPRVML